jgi:hypothetical protein
MLPTRLPENAPDQKLNSCSRNSATWNPEHPAPRTMSIQIVNCRYLRKLPRRYGIWTFHFTDVLYYSTLLDTSTPRIIMCKIANKVLCNIIWCVLPGDDPLWTGTCRNTPVLIIIYTKYLWQNTTICLLTSNPCYRSGQALRVPERWGPQISRQSAHQSGEVSFTHRQHWPPGTTPGTHFFSRLSQPHGYSEVGRIMSMKNSMTPLGIEPATFRHVAQCLNQLRYREPICWLSVISIDKVRNKRREVYPDLPRNESEKCY